MAEEMRRRKRESTENIDKKMKKTSYTYKRKRKRKAA
jgi:hypothetical protein